MSQPETSTINEIERAFVRLDEGQLHLRRLPAAQAGHVPMLILHPSPASSWFMQDLMLELRNAGCLGEIIAPDTLGNGDSPAPGPAEPDIAYFAGSMDRLCTALGFEQVDAYGSHTGARIACEMAAAYPARIRRVVLDGITEYEDDLRDAVIAHYAPVVEPDEYGRHFIWAFNFCRDQALFFPHFMKDAAHRLAVPMPPPQVLHRMTLDVLKALDTYPKPYIAAFRYRAFEHMARITAPTLLLKPETELALLNASVKTALGLLADGHEAATGGSPAAKAAAMMKFLKKQVP
ncbi:alpha/beta fold hydrolase [Novosphingobium sp. P6W]|uniref:alpha/beta fold hydrolase n=1 Tax=Novosphingobium sp. P6W TaxID=1609758 RepID=UPI0005C32594|nr:alpha/beta fold hydrolase [Novosphingobium sp. P6W]AXB79409.1 alpha/beta fold hydrolase [Novosphingobium sp. P6W]KIS34174.1 alpha/beta hydrolase [Novosphingobium sp. P6W]